MKDWLLPFLLSGGIGFGALVGYAVVAASNLRQEGPAGDTAGAFGALLTAVAVVAAFLVASFTTIAARLLRRGPPSRLGLRLAASIAAGLLIGAMATPSNRPASMLSQCLLMLAPVLLSWVGRQPKS